jgi:hypothetical protein
MNRIRGEPGALPLFARTHRGEDTGPLAAIAPIAARRQAG